MDDWNHQQELEQARWIAEGCPPIWGTHELTTEELSELDEWLDARNKEQEHAESQ